VTDIFPTIDPVTSTTKSELRVRFCETDLMGIVHHATYLVYMETGRVEWLRRRGVTFSEWASRGIHVAVVEAHVNYRVPLRFDDAVVVETTLSELRAVSLKYTYVLWRDGTKIADGFTRLAYVNESQKLVRIPDDVRDALLAPELPIPS
jgi:acyl-CoA thioester hydrolase